MQYRESDLDFVDRLLQDEGITISSSMPPTGTRWCWRTRPSAHETCPQYEHVPYYPKSELARRERDHIYEWDAGAEVRPGSSPTPASTSRRRAPTS